MGYTLDTPVPYRLVDLISLIDERMGKLENRSSRIIYHKLLSRIETVRNDPRYAFMFDNANVGGDTMAEVISHLFRLPANGRPMTVMQLAGFPAEVIDSVVSVLCRMAFDFGLWSDGVSPMLFVCEEAHRYASADRNIGFGPTRKAVSRIAKEGRKYGVYLGLVTQRPAELDATIISQCNTLFTMRLANERDQALLRSAVSDAAANLLSFVPSLGTREVLAFGEGVALPTRLRFKEVPAHQLPRSEATISTVPSATAGHDMHFVGAVLERWRGATSNRDVPNDPGINERPAAAHGGSADAATFAGARSRPLFVAEKAAALTYARPADPDPRGHASRHALRGRGHRLCSRATASHQSNGNFAMTQPIASRFPMPSVDGTAGRHPHPPARGAGKIRLHSERLPDAGLSARRIPGVLCLSRRPDGKGQRSDQGRARDDRGRDLQRQPVPLLRHRAWRDPANPGKKSADRRPDRRQLPQGGYHAAPARHARLRHEGEQAGAAGFGSRFRRCRRPRLFSDDDIWDIAAISAFFALSNRMANVTSMRPNDEFYMMGRLPK